MRVLSPRREGWDGRGVDELGDVIVVEAKPIIRATLFSRPRMPLLIEQIRGCSIYTVHVWSLARSYNNLQKCTIGLVFLDGSKVKTYNRV